MQLQRILVRIRSEAETVDPFQTRTPFRRKHPFGVGPSELSVAALPMVLKSRCPRNST